MEKLNIQLPVSQPEAVKVNFVFLLLLLHLPFIYHRISHKELSGWICEFSFNLIEDATTKNKKNKCSENEKNSF